MTTMTLYNNDLSPFTTRVRIQIRAKGLENDIAMVARPEGEAYKLINPLGKVPSLDTGGGFVLPESETIAEYIEDSYPEPSLRGHTALGKAKVRLFSRLVDLYLMPGFAILFGQLNPAARDPAKVEEGLKKIDEALGHIEHYLEGPLFATERRLTLADCALVPALFFSTNVLPMAGGAPFGGRAKIQAYYETITRDDVACAMAVAEMGVAMAAMSRR